MEYDPTSRAWNELMRQGAISLRRRRDGFEIDKNPLIESLVSSIPQFSDRVKRSI
jgi:hypothetical protein